MTNIDEGTMASKRATWRKINPRALLHQLIEGSPHASETIWRKLFWLEVENDPDYLHAIVEYWLDHNLRAIKAKDTRPSSVQAQAARVEHKRRTQQAKVGLQQRVAHEAKLVLLALVMPNGKQLGQCTGSDCLSFGGWFASISDIVPATAKVADILSEKQVHMLWQKKNHRAA